MSLARDVIAQLRAALASIAGARDATTAVQGQADEIAAEIRIATDGSTAEKPTEAVVRLEQAKVKLDEAKIEFQAGDAAVEEYIEYLERGGGGSGGSPPPTGGQRPTGGGPPPIPAAVRRLADQLPQWEEDEPTQALAYHDEDGVEEAFISGQDLSSREGLKPEFARRWVMDHAESKVAAKMREPGAHKHITAVINKEPCGGAMGCDATMPHIIPAESSVRIFVTDGGTVRHFGTYRGTGEGLA